MKIIVKKILGKECGVDIMPTETVLQLKHKLADLFGIEVPQQRLIFKGKPIFDEKPLSFYPGIKDGSRLHLFSVNKTGEGSSEGKTLQQMMGECSYERKTLQQMVGVRLLHDEVSKVLRHYYTESETESIFNELIKDLEKKVNNLSYDDLERLATALLQDQENID